MINPRLEIAWNTYLRRQAIALKIDEQAKHHWNEGQDFERKSEKINRDFKEIKLPSRIGGNFLTLREQAENSNHQIMISELQYKKLNARILNIEAQKCFCDELEDEIDSKRVKAIARKAYLEAVIEKYGESATTIDWKTGEITTLD